MSVFEAKLNSIPASGVEYSAEQLPDAAPAPAPAPPPPRNADPAAPPPPGAPAAPAADSSTEAVPEAEAAAAPAGPVVKDHPEYSKYFKMLKVGVPLPVVEGKMRENGLDPAYLETPEAPAPGNAAAGGDHAGDID